MIGFYVVLINGIFKQLKMVDWDECDSTPREGGMKKFSRLLLFQYSFLLHRY